MKAKLLLLSLLMTSAAHADVLMPTDNGAKYADNRVRLTATLAQDAAKPPATKHASLNTDTKVSALPESSAARQKTITITPDGKAVPISQTDDKSESPSTATPAPLAPRSAADLPIRELYDPIEVSFRDRILPSAIRTLSPPGWVVDLQIDESAQRSLVNFSGESTYQQALADILEPQGLTFLAYRNMKPKPLIVITHGGKK